MVDYAPPSYLFPSNAGSLVGINTGIAPLPTVRSPINSSSGHRTSSPSVLPFPTSEFAGGFRRHPSTSTTASRSTSSTSMKIRRSDSVNTTSSTGTSPRSTYVATLRRQKATVWCDRSQPEDTDPRILAAQRADKHRATLEVMGSSSSPALKGHGVSASNSSLSMRNKLGKSGHNLSVMGIGSFANELPPRLSASEANGDSSDEDDLYIAHHRRSDSGRSSLNSNHRRASRTSFGISGDSRGPYTPLQRQTSKSGSSRSNSLNYTIGDYGESRGKSKSPPQLVSPHILEETSPEVRQHSSDYFNTPVPPPQDKAALKRRGSVDEGEARTMTMTGLRLVVANPD